MSKYLWDCSKLWGTLEFLQMDFGGVSVPRLFLGWHLRGEKILTL